MLKQKFTSVLLTIFLFVIVCSFSQAQNKGLYIPLNIKKSLDDGVRSMDGKPGPNYWINHSDYNINAELYPDKSMLDGSETITYYNESPDTLKMLVIRLYQNIMKKGGVREFPVDTKDLTDGEDVKSLVVGGDTINVNELMERYGRYMSPTNLMVRLKNPLPPKSKVDISASWSFHIPEISTIRMGNYGGDFFIAYWYPQISVYDDIDGWDMIGYTGQVEFYNDFSNYNFNVTLPDKYVVWATGDLQNPTDVFKQDVIDKLDKAKQSDEVVNIVKPEDYIDGKVTKKNGMNTWKFKADHVTDVSFCTSDHYVWDAASVQVDDSGRRVLTEAVYPDSTPNFNEAAKFARATVDYLSHQLPGIPYPYSHSTTFCNKEIGGGMETPMMANDGAPKERGRAIEVISHEICHTLMPFYMGINERKYAWMDEGWATFFPTEIVDGFDPDYHYKQNEVRSYERQAGYEAELPMIIPSYSYKGRFSTDAFYQKPATFYYQLEDLLGRDMFKKCLDAYMMRWHDKHPIPIDFFDTFNNISGEDLSWFIKPWFYQFGIPDLALIDAVQNGNNIDITVQKVGNIPTAIALTITFEDGTTQSVNKSAKEWENGKDSVTISVPVDKKIKEVKLGSPDIPDANQNNNSFTLK
jgi:Peptidase family M1 domain